MEKNYRKASLDDIPLIQTLAEICFRDTYQMLLSRQQMDYMMVMMYSDDALTKAITGNQTFFIVQLEDKPCGYFAVETINGKEYILQKIYLLPNIQKQGLGQYIIDQSRNYVRMLGGEGAILRLHVNRDNSAVDFYLKMGFRIETTGDFDIGSGFFMNDYIMRMDI